MNIIKALFGVGYERKSAHVKISIFTNYLENVRKF
jgi:hypothetical protein